MTASPIDNQHGAILLIAMIMLLLLTIIGLSSMHGTSLQETMAGNMRDSSLALQAAEAALRQGENVVNKKFMTNTLDTLSGTPLSGTYSKFPGVTTAPAYSVTLLAKLRIRTLVWTAEEGGEDDARCSCSAPWPAGPARRSGRRSS